YRLAADELSAGELDQAAGHFAAANELFGVLPHTGSLQTYKKWGETVRAAVEARSGEIEAAQARRKQAGDALRLSGMQSLVLLAEQTQADVSLKNRDYQAADQSYRKVIHIASEALVSLPPSQRLAWEHIIEGSYRGLVAGALAQRDSQR